MWFKLLEQHFQKKYEEDPGNGGGGGGKPDPKPPVDFDAFARKVAGESIAAFVKDLGFNSADELKNKLQGGGKPPKKQTEPDPSELEAKDKRIAQLEAEKQDAAVNETILEALHGHDIHDPIVMKQILRSAIAVKDGAVYIKDEHGNPRFDEKGNKLSVKDYVERMKTEKPYLFATVVEGGAGIEPGQRFTPSLPKNQAEVLKKDKLTFDEIVTALDPKKK